MAFSSVGSLLTDTHGTGSSSWTTSATLTRALNAGQLGVIILATDNGSSFENNANMHESLTDSVGNLWLKAREWNYQEGGVTLSAADVSVWYTVAKVTLPTNGTFTVTFSPVASTLIVRKAMSGWVYGIGANSFVQCRTGVDASHNSADPSSMTNVQLISAEYVWVRAIAAETNSLTFTPTSGFTGFTAATSDSGTSTSSIAVKGEFQIFTGTDLTSDPTATAVDAASAYVTFMEIPKSSVIPSQVLTKGASTTDANSYATASFTASAFKLLVAWVGVKHSSDPPTPTLSGNGLTWTQMATVVDTTTDYRLTMFCASGIPSTGALTIGMAGVTVQGCVWIVEEYDNAYAGIGAIAQTATGSRTTAADLLINLSAFSHALNATIAGFLTAATTITSGRPGSNYGRTAVKTLDDSTRLVLSSQWRYDNDTTVDYVDSIPANQPANALGIAAEVRLFLPPAAPGRALQATMGSCR